MSQFVRINTAVWTGPMAAQASRAGMTGRVVGPGNGPGHIRVEWLNQSSRSFWTYTEAPPNYFRPISALELLAEAAE